VYGTTIASRAGSVCGLGVDWNRNRNWPCPVRESTRTWRSLGSHIWTAEKKERRKPNNSHVITVRRSINLSNTPTPRITNSCERHLKKWSILQLLAKIAVHHFIQLYDVIFVLFVIGLFFLRISSCKKWLSLPSEFYTSTMAPATIGCSARKLLVSQGRW
jgi:hypothetical protein